MLKKKRVIDPALIEKALSGFESPEEADLFIKALEEYAGIGKSKIEDDLRSVDFIEKPVDMYTFLKEPYYLGIIDTVYPKLVDDLIEFFDPGNAYFLGLFGGSVSLDALVQEADGGLSTLGERLGHVGDVAVLLDDGLAISTTEAAHCSGVKEVVRLTLANGMRLDLTSDHKVRIYKGGYQWIPAGELQRDDLVVVARRVRTRPSSHLTAAEAKLLAYWVANGSSSETRGRFCSGNHKASKEVLELLRRLGFEGSIIPKGERCWEVSVSRVKRSGFLEWLQKYGANVSTRQAVVPEAVCRSYDHVVASFLNRLWACEGTVYASPKGSSPPRFLLGMISERIVRQVQLLLLRFGIQARIREVNYTDKRNRAKRKIWHLTVSGMEQLRRFLDIVGPILGKEAACQRIADYCSRTNSNTNVDLLPITHGWLNDRMVESGMIRRADSPWRRLNRIRRCRLSRAMFCGWLGDYGQTPLGQTLWTEFPEDIAYERILSVEPQLVHIPVGDIGAHNEYRFIANGLSVHNSIGWGKSTFSEIAIARIIYEVSCLKNPQKTYRMVKEDKLFFANVSVTHTQAKRVIFEGLKGKIKGSDYFRTVFPYQDFATELRFPNNVLLAACTQSQVIGMNTFAAAMDEANFMPIVERSQTAKLRGGKRLYDQAEVVFTALLRRMETRYLRFGNLPGKLMALSSSQYPDDFMERKAALYQGNKNVFVRNYAIWDTKPEDTYSKERFIIFFNRESGLGRVPKDDEKLGEEEEKIEVPIEFRHDFEIDMEGSLRDLAGKATVAIEPFITKRDMIAKMYEDNRRHPFSAYETTLRDGAYVLRDVLCQWVKEENEFGVVKFEGLRPKVNPKTRRYVHIDPSISGDAAGFCMGHVSHYEERTRWRTIQIIEPGTLEPKTKKEAFTEMLPLIYVDLWLRIVPPPAGEIILGDIRQLIFELKEMGFRFALITMDSFQSKDTQQQLKEKGMNVEELSVDVNPQPYNRLKMALYETRLKGYLHPFGVNELRQLEWNKRKGKVDHRPAGNKDMSDSLAGVVYNCETKKVAEPVAPSLGIVESTIDDEIKRKFEETKWLLSK